jgi:hypothetical protein
MLDRRDGLMSTSNKMELENFSDDDVSRHEDGDNVLLASADFH